MPAPSEYRARDLVTVPSLLSLCRLPLAAAFPFAARPVVGLAIMAAAGLSDVLDGWYARRFRQQTPTGAVLDGIMDKLFVLAVAVTLVVHGTLTVVEALVLGARELGEAPLVVVSLVRRAPRLEDVAAPRTANALGKVATVLQFVAVAMAMLAAPLRTPAIGVTGVVGAVAAVSYWRRELGSPQPGRDGRQPHDRRAAKPPTAS
jgi:CDP-diacylglycerol--glycerol-3-phosphate 3-phosphatidyltransferase/cardiolipin synthase